MKNSLLFFISFVVIVSCNSFTTKKDVHNIASRKYISVVDKTHGYSFAYTEEGHIMIYGKDSTNDYIVYFAKFDKNAGKYENSMIKDKIVRAELDSTLGLLKNFVTISGGAFCDRSEYNGYNVYYFDDKLNGNNIERIEVPELLCDINREHLIKRILELLNIGYNIAFFIKNTNAVGWHNIVSAMEPIQELRSYDVMENDTIYNPVVNKHISKISITEKGFTQFYNMLQEKYNRQRDSIQ